MSMVWNEAALICTAFLAFIFSLAFFIYEIKLHKKALRRLIPPGSFGWPLIGETLDFLECQRSGNPHEFFQSRTEKYGNVFATSLLGHQTVVLFSPEGNRFLFANENKLVVKSWPSSIRKLFGTALNVTIGDDARKVRRSLMTFLRPEALQKFVGRIDSMTKRHLAEHWISRDKVTVFPLIKRYTFSVACDLFASIHNCDDDEAGLLHHFMVFVKGVTQIPIDLPGTRYNEAKHAADAIRQLLDNMIHERKIALKNGKASPDQDLLSFLLSNGESPLTDKEIKDNILLLLHAGHDTVTSTMSLLLMFLAENPHCYDEVLRGIVDETRVFAFS